MVDEARNLPAIARVLNLEPLFDSSQRLVDVVRRGLLVESILLVGMVTSQDATQTSSRPRLHLEKGRGRTRSPPTCTSTCSGSPATCHLHAYTRPSNIHDLDIPIYIYVCY